jgi:hypothetical protein
MFLVVHFMIIKMIEYIEYKNFESRTWLMRLNEQKCKIMHIGKTNQHHPYTISTLTDTHVPMTKTDVEKDLRVYLSSDLNEMTSKALGFVA